MSLIAELKRRSVFKVGAAYLVVAWLVIQAASIAMPAFDAPGWVLRTFILLAMLGFPIALVMAWVFDVAPDGVVKVEHNDRSSLAFFGVVGGLAALSLAWYYLGQPATREQGADARSIAVLPFENMSGDAANDYFSDGISEELLNQLAKMPELRVAARTSSFSFKGEKVEIPAIAQALKVRMVLEGSVRKQGERVRITAQLIDAQEGFHVWSETYDRDLKDIFAIQDEIARAIAKELRVKIAGAPAAGAADVEQGGGTEDLEAYDLYLRGLAQWQLRTPASLVEADRLFQQAVQRDPKFARAWGGIALVATVVPYWTAVDVPAYERKGRAAAARALALDPISAEAVAALGNLDRLHVDRWPSSLVLLWHAEELNPSFAIVPVWIALQQVLMGQPEAALASVRRAVELDPRSPIIANVHSNVLNANGRFAEGIEACAEVVRANPGAVGCQANILAAALHLEDRAEVRRILLELARVKGTPGARELAVAIADALDGKGDRAAVAQRLMATPHQSAFDPASPNAMFEAQLTWVLMQLGEPALAVKRLANAIETRPDNVAPVLWHPASDPLRCRDDFKALVEKIGYPDLRAAKVCGSTPAPTN